MSTVYASAFSTSSIASLAQSAIPATLQTPNPTNLPSQDFSISLKKVLTYRICPTQE